jgi:hypothetical protein
MIYECNTTISLTDDEKNALDIIAIKMATLRTEIIPYPNEYFHGRGIVLTTGKKQFKFARINLKMLEITGTRLPVQVISFSLSKYDEMFIFSIIRSGIHHIKFLINK